MINNAPGILPGVLIDFDYAGCGVNLMLCQNQPMKTDVRSIPDVSRYWAIF
jgi:hypothetical protein